ncbi:MAG: hypothetical protein GX478_04095 [Erysipelotrichaceae bacterium]|nr:hypothetical protein [Erysipelotrichaceae bacterium]
MNKIMIGITTAVLTAGLGMTTVLAENNQTTARTAFVDENGDGICDNAGADHCRGNGQGYIDANNDGICDNAGDRQNCIDANGDGVYGNGDARQCMTSGTCRRGNNWNQ